MVSHVLVAVDGSSHADRALEFAAEFAVKYGAGLTILNVVSYASTVPLALGAYAELEGLYAESRAGQFGNFPRDKLRRSPGDRKGVH